MMDPYEPSPRRIAIEAARIRKYGLRESKRGRTTAWDDETYYRRAGIEQGRVEVQRVDDRDWGLVGE